MTVSSDQLTHEASRYKCLAEAVIIQAIKDATHSIGSDKKYRNSSHLHSMDSSTEAANHFLLADAAVFTFWCQVAGLVPDEVRRQLARKLKYKRTYKLIRSLNRYRRGEVV